MWTPDVGGLFVCVCECICVSADMLSTGWQLVLSQSAGGSTIFRKPYARTVCNGTQ